MKLIVVSSRYSRTSRAYPDDKAYRRHWPSNPALTHMLIILSWLVASVQMVSFQVKVDSFHHAGSTLPLCDNRGCFCHGCCKPGYHSILFVAVFDQTWLKLNLVLCLQTLMWCVRKTRWRLRGRLLQSWCRTLLVFSLETAWRLS